MRRVLVVFIGSSQLFVIIGGIAVVRLELHQAHCTVLLTSALNMIVPPP